MLRAWSPTCGATGEWPKHCKIGPRRKNQGHWWYASWGETEKLTTFSVSQLPWSNQAASVMRSCRDTLCTTAQATGPRDPWTKPSETGSQSNVFFFFFFFSLYANLSQVFYHSDWILTSCLHQSIKLCHCQYRKPQAFKSGVEQGDTGQKGHILQSGHFEWAVFILISKSCCAHKWWESSRPPSAI